MEIMGTPQQGPAGRKRLPNRERPTAEDDALNQIAREAEARLAAKRAARAEAREIRMKELERQQKEIYQVQKKYYGLDTKFGDIEQWMEDSERYTRKSRRNPSASDEDERMSVGSRGSLRASCYSDLSLHCSGFPPKSQSSCQNGNRASLYDENFNSGNRRYSASSSRPPSEYSCYLGSGSRASSRASSARASPVVEERPEKDFEKGVRTVSSLSAATLASLGGTSSRRGSGDTSISVDTEASIREIKDINELKDQIQDVEGKYMQGLKEMKDSLAEVEEKYKKAMVSNAQLDNEKTNFMYQVDTLKDALLELEEQLAESRRQYEEKSKDFEREKHAHSILQFQFMEVKEALKQREELLAEIRQLQQKQEGYVREMSDLQETIEWKEKKIGALERQKEFFDSIRSERDDLREEVVVLKEQLKQHGIIPHSGVTTNGETFTSLDNDGRSSPSKIVPGSSHVPNVAGDGTLGRTKEVEMKNEILENVGKREILQNTEDEEHTEETKEQETVQECSERNTLHADENTEAENITEGKVASTLLLNSGLEEPAKSLSDHVPEIVYSLETSDVAELRGEGGSFVATTEIKESDENVNKIANQNNVVDDSTETNQETNAGLEMFSQKQTVDEAECHNSDKFQEGLDFANSSHIVTSSESESAKLTENILNKPSNTYSSPDQSEDKMVESEGLEIQSVQDLGGVKSEGDENEAGVINEGNEAENVVQDKMNEREQAEMLRMTEEQKPLEMEDQHLSLKHDTFIQEELDKEGMEVCGKNSKESSDKDSNKRRALLGPLDDPLDSAEQNEENALKEVHTKDAVDDEIFSECQAFEEGNSNPESKSGNCKGLQSELADEKLIDTSVTHLKVTGDSNEEDKYNQMQAVDCSTDKQVMEKTSETAHKSAITESVTMENVQEISKDNEEKKNCGKTEEKAFEEVLHPEVSACLVSPEAKFTGQMRKLDSDEEEDTVEEYHEAFDFDESPLGELATTAGSKNQGKESKKTDHQDQEIQPVQDLGGAAQSQEKGGTAQSAAQIVIKEDCEKVTREKLAEEDAKGRTCPVGEVVFDDLLTVSEKTQQQNKEEDEYLRHSQTESPVSLSSEPPCETLEDISREMLGAISVRQVTEYTAEQLEKLGSSVDEIQEEDQVSRRGKGKSREDCIIS
uniref:LRR binding FLII interacting protein 1 n=1 Tax=Salvator merianae TaxID=96440 RepID=A0A8D0E6Y0_SALMN